MTEEFDNKNEAGAIWLREKDGKRQLSIVINGRQLTGFPNAKKGDNAKAPDFLLVEYSEAGRQEVGAAWKGETKQARQKLSIKLSDNEFFTAVMRDKQIGNSADMTIFKPTAEEQVAVAAQAAEAEPPAAPAAAPAKKRVI